ncbi:MAG TPA: hypothetical protein VIH99_03345 [Bdellovibrionota bacterium]|jgi:hypothetical protein
MIHKGRCLAILAILALFPMDARSERRAAVILETSTTGKLVRMSLGSHQGMNLGDPVLFAAGSKKVAAGRVIRVQDGNSIVVVLEKYGTESPAADSNYDVLFGNPVGESPNLPDFVADRENELDNPTNEKFWTKENDEVSPELDDDNYTPEVAIRPKFPLPRTYSAHNITVGLNMFRNHTLAGENDDVSEGLPSTYTTYNGYSIRYAYTFRSHYWLKMQAPALLSAEFGFGMYTFPHTFPASIRPDPTQDATEVRVIPIQVGLRYLVEVSKLFRLYPYVGYQYNVVSAVNGSLQGLEPLMGGRLVGGGGAVLVMSDTIDTRVEGGSDGVMAGLVVKF